MMIIKEPNEFSTEILCRPYHDGCGSIWGKVADYCGAMLKIDKNDICYRLYRHYRDFDVNKDYGVKCPCCGSFIMLSGFIPPLA
jgi:hypothetical protein